MKRVLHQDRRSDWVILRNSSLTERQLQEYEAELKSFSNVHKWVLSARLSAEKLASHVFPSLKLHLETLSVLDLSHNIIKTSRKHTISSPTTLQITQGILSHGSEKESVRCPVLELIYCLQLHRNTVLKILKLADNPLGDFGAVMITRSICRLEPFIEPSRTHVKNVDLHVLDFAQCGISDSGAVEISLALKMAAFGEPFFLKLNKNRIGPKGTFELGSGLSGMISLSVTKNRPSKSKENSKQKRKSRQVK